MVCRASVDDPKEEVGIMLRREFIKLGAFALVPFNRLWAAIAPATFEAPRVSIPLSEFCQLPQIRPDFAWQVLCAEVDGWRCKASWKAVDKDTYQVNWLRMCRDREASEAPQPILHFYEGKAWWISGSLGPPPYGMSLQWNLPTDSTDIILDESPFGFRFSESSHG